MKDNNILKLKDLKIGSVNCQGIKNKIDDLVFQNEIKQHDIFAVNETWLSKEKTINIINGYKFFPLCRGKELGNIRGGIGWFIREDLRNYIKILYSISTENFLWCKLDRTFFNFAEDLYICSVYIPPEDSSREKRLKKDHYKTLIENISNIKSDTIILIGDFNARTKLYEDVIEFEKNVDDFMPQSLLSCAKFKRSNQDKKGNKYGKKLVDLCIKTKLYIANGRTLGDLQGKYTCYENGTSCVDYAIISEKLHSYIYKLNISEPFLASDHCVLRLTITLPKKAIKITSKNESMPTVKWNESNKNKFLNFIKLPCTIKRIKEIENEVDNRFEADTSKTIKSINELYTISGKLLRKGNNSKFKSKQSKQWYDYSCFEMNKRLQLVAKLLSKSPKNPYLRGSFVKTRKEYKRLIREKKIAWKNNILNKLENMKTQNSKEYWDIINDLKGKQKKTIINDPDKFEAFFKKLYSNNIEKKGPFHQHIENIVKQCMENEESVIKLENKILDADITIKELKEHIKKMKNNKSTGPDGIPSEMIKCSSDILLNLILKVINKIKTNKVYPDIWCFGITSLIFKDGDDENPNNYRGINVSNVLSKLFISIINERCNKILSENRTIGDYQIGFKEKTRPADHLFILKSIINKYIGNGKKLYTCFIDYEKAYDNVWREGLYYKMIKSGLTTDIVKLIKNMYDKNKQSLKMNGYITDPILTVKGVKQGCVISPLIFNLFINDLPKCFNDACKPVNINNTKINCLMYADDVILLSETKEGLVKSLENLYTYNEKWCLNINIKKTKIMTFQKFGKLKYNEIKYNETVLEHVKQFKYLGTIIDKSGGFKQNDIFLKKKGLRASFSIINSLGTNMKISSLIKIFEKAVEPIILYNCEITQAFIPNNWSYFKFKNNIWNQCDQISKVVNSYLRQILGVGKNTSTWGILTETGKYPISVKVYIQIMKYWIRLLNIESKYMQESHISCLELWNEGKNSWCKIIEFLIKYTNMDQNFKLEYIISNPNKFLNEFEYKLTQKILSFWKIEVNSKRNTKLDFYKNIKKQFSFEKYLDIMGKEDRIPMTCIRLSNHNFPIEKLRYQKVEREKRICSICNLNEIGNEMHYLVKCGNTNITNLRDKFINNINQIQPQFEQFDCMNIIGYCLNMNDKLIYKLFSVYVKYILKVYKEETNTQNMFGI